MNFSGISVILNDDVWYFKFSVIDDKFYLFLFFSIGCYGTIIYPLMDSSKSYINREPSTLVGLSIVVKLNKDKALRVQILDETDCISHNTNTFGKDVNPIILPPAMGK